MDGEIVAEAPQPAALEARGWAKLWAWLRRQSESDAARTALLAWLALRLYCTLVGGVVYALAPGPVFHVAVSIGSGEQSASCAPFTQSFSSLGAALVGIWLRWDSLWYLEIARHSYGCYGSSAFMPLYPASIRGLGVLLAGNDLAAALLVASLACLVAFYLLYQLAWALTASVAVARASVVALAVYPLAFFLMAGYTEALFLALAIGSYLCARRGYWLGAGLLAALATLTRLQGILLVVPLGLEALQDYRSTLRRWQVWLALALAPLALLLYAGYIRLTQGLGNPWEPLSAARGSWHLHYAWPWQGLAADLSPVFTHPSLASLLAIKPIDPLTAIPFAVCTILAFRRLNVPLAAFMIAMWITAVIKVGADGTTVSVSRYMLGLFPAFIVAALFLVRWPRPVQIGLAILALALLTLNLCMFFLWGWVA